MTLEPDRDKRSSKRIHRKRSRKAQIADESLEAKIAPSAKAWAKDPSRSDLPGVDTPTGMSLNSEDYNARLQQLDKMDKIVSQAKHAYFSATAVSRRPLSRKEKEAMVTVLSKHQELQRSLGIKPYSLDEDLLKKVRTSLATHDESQELEQTARRVKFKRGHSEVVDLDESDFKRPAEFHERPTAGKKFTDLKGLGKDYDLWELSEYEYHRFNHYRELGEAEGQIKYRIAILGKKRSDGKHVTRGQKREIEESALHYWKKRLKTLSETTPEETWKTKTKTPQEYSKTIKKAIKSGKPVPQEVINQYPEFKKAEDARERYEKGRHTSFANRSIAINESMREERGFKVKRQDGKAITSTQIEEISTGVSEIESVLGSMEDMFRHTDLTIAHTSGKHPFLSKASGQYSIFDRTVTMGTDSVPSLAHEIGHWLDFESGKAHNKAVRKRRGKKYVTLSSIAEIKTSQKDDQLIAEATRRMNDVRETEQIMKTKLKSITDPTERKRIQRIKVKLGTYWYEPNEVWARVFEQYVATEAAERGRTPDVSVFSKMKYNSMPAYWTEDNFEVLKPLMEKQIQERLAIVRSNKIEGETK